MEKLQSVRDLRAEIAKSGKSYKELFHGHKKHVVICSNTGCMANHAQDIIHTLYDLIEKEGLKDEVLVSQGGCLGYCSEGPFVKIYPEGTLYRLVKASDVHLIVEKDLKGNGVVDSLIFKDEATGKPYPRQEDIPFYQKQKRIALLGYDSIDPNSIEQYMGLGGYMALAHVIEHLTPDEVISQCQESGLRGRGGGGYPTGIKWRYARNQNDFPKYLVCNLDEGDPGAFMDRSITESTPHEVIEGMIIAAYAIGASQGFVYIRAEYPIAYQRLETAIAKCREIGLLGDHILGTDFSFDIELRVGAGAFVCGEETALLASIEGKRGMPRSKPPFPAVKGLWGKPTIINNVETLANLSFIFKEGGLGRYKEIGTEKSKGTKVFSLAGKVKNIGLIEVPMGTTLRTLIYDIGGGIEKNRKFKAIQTGGPSGGCLVEEDLDTPIDYETLINKGSMMGSGGAIVMDEDNCMVDVARFYMEFITEESCGKCSPCRIGTTRMKEILDKITRGQATLEDLVTLKELGLYIKDASLCGLGQTAPNPVLSTLEKFYDEYIAHVVDKKCPAKVCKSLITFNIDKEKCKKCGICAKNCPVSCISGVRGAEPYEIDQKACVKCGTCVTKCPFGAISRN